jgi:ABC-2 type transport system permease protein
MADSISRLLSLIRKEFIQIARDPRTLILAIWIPIMQLLLMGYAATTDVRNVPMAVLDQDRSPASRRLLEAFRAADYFVIALDVQSLDELRAALDDGSARAGLIIPPDYALRLNAGQSASIAIVLDGSDPSVGSTALNAAHLIASEHSTRILQSRLNRLGGQTLLQPPIEAHTQVWYNPDMVSAYFMVPGVIAQILYSLTSVLTASAVVRERERGTIEQLIVTPIRPWELIVGKTVPYVLLAFLNTLEVLALGSFIFDVPIRGELSMILLLSGLFLLTGLGIGLLASTVANTQQEAMMSVFMTMLPTIFLSGFFFPLEAMPKVLQWISYLVPMRYFLVIIRSLTIKGVSASALTDEIIALTLFAVAILGLAVMRFRKRLD